MRASMVLFAAALALPALPAPAARAQGREAATVAAAIEVLEQAALIPRRCIPLCLLRKAKGVAIIPGVIKAGFIVGARRGRGVVLVRSPNCGWSNPIFVTLTGGSIGLQAGAQSTDLVLVFKTQRGLKRILRNAGKLTLGADVSVAAGPVGREAAAATDAQLHAEIFSYSRSRGLFVGASFDGDVLLIDRAGNDCFYGRRCVSVADIILNNGILVPPVALKLRALLTAQTNPPLLLPPGPPPVILERPR